MRGGKLAFLEHHMPRTVPEILRRLSYMKYSYALLNNKDMF
jgi:hypothetical protein